MPGYSRRLKITFSWRDSTTMLRPARLCSVKHRAHTYAFSSLPFLAPFSLTSNTLRTAGPLAGLLVQPNANADPPSGWLVLSVFVGFPIALWAYKVRLVKHFRD
jgi:hypothetical protein